MDGYSLEPDGDEVLADEAYDLLVGVRHNRRGRELDANAVARGPVAVDVRVRRRRPVGARLVHGGGRRQSAGPLARRPVPCALVPRVTGGQTGPRAATSAPRSPERRDHKRSRRIGLEAAAE